MMPEGSLYPSSTPEDAAQDRLQRRLAGLNRRRFTPALPDGDWERDREELAALEHEEANFLEARRAAVAARAAEAPTDQDGFVAWFEELDRTGPGQGDPLFPWL